MPRPRLILSLAPGLCAAVLACTPPAAPDEPPPQPAAAPPAEPAPDVCPAEGVAPVPMPRTRPEHETLAYWLARTAEVADLDRPVLTAAEVAALNAAARTSPALGFGGRVDLRAPVDLADLAAGLENRLGYLRERFAAGKYVHLDGTPLGPDEQAAYAGPVTAGALAQGFRAPVLPDRTGTTGQVPKDSPEFPAAPELRVALDLVPIYCGPRKDPYYTTTRDPAFDRNLCSMARPQEVVQILRPWHGDLVLARTTYVAGWIDARAAALSPPLADAEARAFLDGPWQRVGHDLELKLEDGERRVPLPFASLVPVARGEHRVMVATDAGVRVALADDPGLQPAPRPLTRRAVLTDAFAYLGQRYGWGDREGGRDCSRYLMDLFAGIGLEIPRHTSDQAIAGSYTVDVPATLPEPDRLALLDEHLRRGVVLLHFPGHIMMYLGRDADGVPMAIHSFAEYLVPCGGRVDGAPAGERETLLKVDGVHVSDLELGRGSSRTAFIQRITKITVFGPRPAP
ncbi:MAG: C40 family peptidase [Myxococcales bacterium]|nr:C40 family peptidase [Myxococcales bacterium]